MFPNLVHLVIIKTVLDRSALILYGTVLPYLGVGVNRMNSFGGLIHLACTEMARDPLAWWSFAAAFRFMVTLVLAANLFADGGARCVRSAGARVPVSAAEGCVVRARRR